MLPCSLLLRRVGKPHTILSPRKPHQPVPPKGVQGCVAVQVVQALKGTLLHTYPLSITTITTFGSTGGTASPHYCLPSLMVSSNGGKKMVSHTKEGSLPLGIFLHYHQRTTHTPYPLYPLRGYRGYG